MAKHKKKEKKPSPPKVDLDYAVGNFFENCELCGHPLIVHGHCKKKDGKKEKIFAHCGNTGDGVKTICRKYNQEIAFIESFF